ncbi:MAG: Integral membrane protein, partial [uncultured Pseudonocardia sp.]
EHRPDVPTTRAGADARVGDRVRLLRRGPDDHRRRVGGHHRYHRDPQRRAVPREPRLPLQLRPHRLGMGAPRPRCAHRGVGRRGARRSGVGACRRARPGRAQPARQLHVHPVLPAVVPGGHRGGRPGDLRDPHLPPPGL